MFAGESFADFLRELLAPRCGEARGAEAKIKADAEVKGALERSPVSRECL
jgi:hypothetical protein